MEVIPQLIARIDTPRALVGRLIHQLLTDIGRYHPQALIYPLTVASKSTTTARHNAANKILKNMCEHCNTLVQQAIMYVSPKLLMCRDLELAVPGTYDPNQSIIRIQSIAASLQVITSKQRPRKLTIMGSNGHEFMFLLKGHEDLRQDERVMQLFGLVNTLLANDPASLRKNLSIQRYAVIPLSTNSGLIGWVPHCDTLHALIRDYREKKKILLNIEHRIMLR
ncbi:hypothetical protein Z043_126318, partial [Scleropages formosus]